LVAGFAREVLLAFVFGTSRDIEIFRIAFGLPSVLSDSLAVSFVAVLIPVILGGEKRRPAQALRHVIWVSVTMALAVFLLGIATMPVQARLLAPGITGADRDTLIIAGRICWLTFLAVILSLPLRALMSTRYRIWPGASSQIMRSGGFALTLAVLAFAFGWRDVLAPAVAAAFGGLAVLGVHILALGRSDLKRVRRALFAPPPVMVLRPLLGALTVVFLTQLLLSGGRLMDRAVASSMEEGMLAALEYSYALLMAVAAMMGTSTNLLLAPRLGRALRDNGTLLRRHWGIILGISALAMLAGLFLAVLAPFIVSLVYEYGAFDSAASRLTSSIFRIHALSLGPLVLALLLHQVLLLKGRQRWAFWSAGLKLAVKALALAVIVLQGWGIEAVAASLAFAEIISVLALALPFVLHARTHR
jgi:peptidoglycan biosynthesis protein MviN/MurJ (putative lipid II flippase)